MQGASLKNTEKVWAWCQQIPVWTAKKRKEKEVKKTERCCGVRGLPRGKLFMLKTGMPEDGPTLKRGRLREREEHAKKEINAKGKRQ